MRLFYQFTQSVNFSTARPLNSPTTQHENSSTKLNLVSSVRTCIKVMFAI